MSNLEWFNPQEMLARPRSDVLYTVTAMLEPGTSSPHEVYYANRRFSDGNQKDLGAHETIEKAYEACGEDFDQLPPMEEGEPRPPLPPRPPRVE